MQKDDGSSITEKHIIPRKRLLIFSFISPLLLLLLLLIAYLTVNSGIEFAETEDPTVRGFIMGALILMFIGATGIICFLISFQRWALFNKQPLTSITKVLLFPVSILPKQLPIWRRLSIILFSFPLIIVDLLVIVGLVAIPWMGFRVVDGTIGHFLLLGVISFISCGILVYWLFINATIVYWLISGKSITIQSMRHKANNG